MIPLLAYTLVMSQPRPTVLLTLGRLPPAIDIARAFRSAGWRVIVADPFRLNMARTSLAVSRVHRVAGPTKSPNQFRRDITDLVRRYDVQLVVPVSEETPWVSGLKHQLTADVFCGEQDCVLELHSKQRFIELAERLELPSPRTARIGTEVARSIALADYVLKPEFSCSGRNVSLHSAGDPIPADSADLLIQERLLGQEISAFVIARSGVCQLMVAYRAHTRHGSVAVCFERVDHASVQSWVSAFVAEINYTGLLSFDFIIDPSDGTARAIECNPRATSGLHFVSPSALVAAICGTDAPADPILKDTTLMQEFWSHWTHWFSVLGDAEERRRTGRALRAARDVTWSIRDPFVMPLATFSTWPIVWQAIRRRTTFAEVLALDIEWRPE
ncbi:MAG: ATP-grasp domain-containing protein [Pseudomonadota bacterium]